MCFSTLVGAAGLNPNSYFGPGGRYNMRRKSDCGAERGGGMQIPDPSYFNKIRRNRSLDRTNDLDGFAQQRRSNECLYDYDEHQQPHQVLHHEHHVQGGLQMMPRLGRSQGTDRQAQPFMPLCP